MIDWRVKTSLSVGRVGGGLEMLDLEAKESYFRLLEEEEVGRRREVEDSS